MKDYNLNRPYLIVASYFENPESHGNLNFVCNCKNSYWILAEFMSTQKEDKNTCLMNSQGPFCTANAP